MDQKLGMNPYDRECMKMAMLKHEEVFRDQVNELHRLYGIQKMLMKDIAEKTENDRTFYDTRRNQGRAWKFPDFENRAQDFSSTREREKCGTLELEDDRSDLELTLGPRNYSQRQISTAEPTIHESDLGLNFSYLSSASKNHTRNSSGDEFLSKQKWAGLELSALSSQERLDSSPWHFQVLSLNMT